MTQPRPFNIRMFVAEGLPDGLRFVEKSNWVGLGIVCPRGRYPHVKKRDEFTRSGVYILVGRDGDDDRPALYIGEGETVRMRLDEHHAKKDFWQFAIVFTTKGDPLNKAEIKYLEALLYELAAATKRCVLTNDKVPSRPSLSESDEAEIKAYLDEMLSLLPVLGVHAFERVSSASASRRTYHFRGGGWNATGYETSSGFAVRAGSIARLTTVPSMQQHGPSEYNKRQHLIADGVLEEGDAGYRFTVDHEFSSPSQAAAVCAGRTANGRIEWKDDKGVTLREHQEREAEA